MLEVGSRDLKTHWEPGIENSAIIHWFIYITKYMSEEVALWFSFATTYEPN